MTVPEPQKSGAQAAPARARLEWLGHATVLLQLGAARVLTDPVLRRRVAHLWRRAALPAAPRLVDAVLLSHLHRDHTDLPTLRRLARGTPVIGPRGTASVLRRGGVRNVREVVTGDAVDVIPGVTVHAVPASHDGKRQPLGTQGEAIGFVVDGPRRVYFAGDTDVFAGMRALAEPALDVALLPVWGWGTTLGAGHMDPGRAAQAAALLRPAVAVPIHWGTFLPVGARRGRHDLLADPPHRFASRAAELAPAVRVVVLQPNEGLEL